MTAKETLDREGKYATEWGILDSEENIGQCGEILDREGKYSIETEKYWIETGDMRQRREIRVGDGK